MRENKRIHLHFSRLVSGKERFHNPGAIPPGSSWTPRVLLTEYISDNKRLNKDFLNILNRLNLSIYEGNFPESGSISGRG